MLINLKALKDGKWAPSIQADIVRALRQADSQKRFVELLGQRRIDVVFRKNERGRIYGVTFIDHNHREVFNGSRMGKVFSANVFNDYFKWLENIPEKERGGHSATELAGLRGGSLCTPHEEKKEDRTQAWHLDKTSINPFIYNSYAAGR